MKRVCALSVIVVAVFFAACSSTKESTGVWVDKEKIKGKAYDNFFVIVMTADIEARVKLENDLADLITSRGHKAVKSYEVLPAGDRFTGQRLTTGSHAGAPTLAAGDLFAILPVALLEREEPVA